MKEVLQLDSRYSILRYLSTLNTEWDFDELGKRY